MFLVNYMRVFVASPTREPVADAGLGVSSPLILMVPHSRCIVNSKNKGGGPYDALCLVWADGHLNLRAVKKKLFNIKCNVTRTRNDPFNDK